jgi:hypothetical protein
MILSAATGQFIPKQQNCPTAFLMKFDYEKRGSRDLHKTLVMSPAADF